MLSAPVSPSKAYVYNLSSIRYRAAFSTADSVRLFSFFIRPRVYPFWFYHLYHLFDDDFQIGCRMRKYVQDVFPMAGLKAPEAVVWQELVLELRSQALQRHFTASCHHTVFDAGTEQERLMARAASFLQMQTLREQAHQRGDMFLAQWFDQTIHAAKTEAVTQQVVMRMAGELYELDCYLSNLTPNADLTVYWGLFTNGISLMRGYVAFGKTIRWSYLGSDLAAAQQYLARAAQSIVTAY